MDKNLHDVARDVYIKCLLAGGIIFATVSVFWLAHTHRVAHAWQESFVEMEKIYSKRIEYLNTAYETMEEKYEGELASKQYEIATMESQLESLYKKTNEVRIASVSDGKKVVVEQLPGSLITVEATAYTADCSGCSGITYTGIDVRNKTPKIIAVDPDVIPLGKKVELFVDGKSWGVWETQDVGSDIKGLRIDILMDSIDKALEFGRQTVQLKILD